MSINTIEKKNEVILNRFESKVSSKVGSRKYTVQFKDGKKSAMICMNGETLREATESAIAVFGKDKVQGVYA